MKRDKKLQTTTETAIGFIPVVSGLLLLHDIEELDNIILELNSRKISLEEFVGKVWNTAYTLGQKDGYHCNNR